MFNLSMGSKIFNIQKCSIGDNYLIDSCMYVKLLQK